MTTITKAAQDAIEAFEAMTKGNERDSDGAWGRIVMPSNAALEKADKAAEAIRAALQDKADTEDHLFEAFGDGPTDDQCADLWRRYPSLRDWHKRTFGALQDKAGEVRQFRRVGCADWYDGNPDHEDGRGPYEARTLYASQPAPVAPDGFAIVPVDPTPEMWQAVDKFAHAGSVWDTMIAASQQKGGSAG